MYSFIMNLQIILLCGFISVFTYAEVCEESHRPNHLVATKSSTSEESSESSTELTKYNVTEIVSEEDLENRLKLAENDLTVIMFYAMWCRFSRQMFPVFEELKNDFPDVVFLKVDVDENPTITQQYNIIGKPSFVFLKNNTRLYTIRGDDKEKLRQKLEEYTVKTDLI